MEFVTIIFFIALVALLAQIPWYVWLASAIILFILGVSK